MIEALTGIQLLVARSTVIFSEFFSFKFVKKISSATLVRETKYASDYNVSQGFIFNQITQDEENARGKIAKIN